MNKIFHIASLFAILLLNTTLGFSQTKVVIYNGNSNQIENKAFAVSLVSSFTNQEFKFEASDKTPNINYLLRNQGQNVESGNVSDEVVVLVCDKLGVDYVVNFILYPNKTQDNVYASLINTKTFSIDKKVTLTCRNLKNSSEVKVTTDKIASLFLLGNLITEKKDKEAQELAKQKTKTENKIEKTINVELKNYNNILSYKSGKLYSNDKKLTKQELYLILDQEEMELYKKGNDKNITGIVLSCFGMFWSDLGIELISHGRKEIQKVADIHNLKIGNNENCICPINYNNILFAKGTKIFYKDNNGTKHQIKKEELYDYLNAKEIDLYKKGKDKITTGAVFTAIGAGVIFNGIGLISYGKKEIKYAIDIHNLSIQGQ